MKKYQTLKYESRNNSSIKMFLTSFFTLFKSYVKEYKIEDEKVLGIIRWQNEEDEQFFSWDIDFDEKVLLKINLLCDVLTQHNLICGDRIMTLPSGLKKILLYDGWNEREAEKTINELCSIRIKMIDNGRETDLFFVHF